MKKEQRDKVLNEILERIVSKDFDEQQHALFQLSLVLERSTIQEMEAAAAATYEDNLDRYQMRLRLSADEQRTAIDALSRLIAQDKPARATAFWAMGRAKPEVVAAPLLALLTAVGNQLNHISAFEAVTALQNCLSVDSLREHLALNDPTSLLAQWTESPETRLSVRAEKVLAAIQEIMR